MSRRSSPVGYADSCVLNEKAQRSFLVSEVGTTYVVLLSSLCLSCTLYHAVTRVPDQSLYFYEILFMALYLTGLGALTYLFVFIKKNRCLVMRRDPMDVNNEGIGLRLSKQDVRRSTSCDLPCISYAGEGFNLYLRAGLIGFNFFSCVYNIIRVISELTDNFDKCGHTAYIIVAILQGCFFCMQTVFILLNHKIIFLSNKPIIRLCFHHLLIVNICSWIHAGLGEISDGIHEVFAKERELKASALKFSMGESNKTTDCNSPYSPVALTRPYLMPAIIEYVLLGIPMLLELLWRVGNVQEIFKEEKETSVSEDEFPIFHKAKRGLIAGLVAFLLSMISIFSYFLLTKQHQVIGLAIYHLEAFSLNILSFVFCVLALHHLSKLKFVREMESHLDEMILRLALFGTFFYYIIVISNSVDALYTNRSSTTQLFTAIEIILAIVTIVACCFQAFVIINGMHRAPAVRDHLVRKPGRPYITVLLCVNLALWVIDTFQVKKSEMAFSVTSTRGGLDVVSSVALMHVALPMVILFRFHSTICLSSIWYKSYLLE